MSQQVELDKSWEENADSTFTYLEGASDFQQKAIEELETEIKEGSLVGDYNEGIIRGLQRAIKIIKNLKA